MAANTIGAATATVPNNWISDVDHSQVGAVLLRGTGWMSVSRGSFKIGERVAQWRMIGDPVVVPLDEVIGVRLA
jgi:hypothetical protein